MTTSHDPRTPDDQQPISLPDGEEEVYFTDFVMPCPACEVWNDPDRITCEECGAGLGDLQRCGACGGESLWLNAICWHCSTVLHDFVDKRGRQWTAGQEYD